jgi:hypothetical protein
MIAGLSGHLLSASFLEGALQAAGREDTASRRLFSVARRRAGVLGPSSSLRTLLDVGAVPALGAVGFEPPLDVERIDNVLAGTLTARMQRLVLIVAPWAEPLAVLVHSGFRQALLRSARWCVLFNGTHLRVVDAARPYSRRFTEFDLDTVADDEQTFAAFAFVIDALPDALHLLVEESERHGVAVCRSLKEGVLSASADVLKALVRSASSPAESFEQALTIVYRILFLLFAEARGLVPHVASRVSEQLQHRRAQRLAERAGGTDGLWEALRAIARLAHAGCRAGDLRVTAFNGRLFAPSGTPLANRHDLDDEAARRTLIALTTRRSPDGGARERIAYRDLEVEQLGTMYERCSTTSRRFVPLPRGAGNGPGIVSLQRGSGVRRRQGRSILRSPSRTISCAARSARWCARRLPITSCRSRILDPAMGAEPSRGRVPCLATAYETALSGPAGATPATLAIRARTHPPRRSPNDVYAASMSIRWRCRSRASHSGWRRWPPIGATFLDHHLQTGDSLLGTWLATLVPDTRAPAHLHATRFLNASHVRPGTCAGVLQAALPVRFSLEVHSQRHRRGRAREGAGTRAPQPARHRAVAVEARCGSLVCALARGHR